MKELDALRSELTVAIEAADGVDALEGIRVSALGKKGRITELMKGLGAMDADARKVAGQELNALKNEIADGIEAHMLEWYSPDSLSMVDCVVIPHGKQLFLVHY